MIRISSIVIPKNRPTIPLPNNDSYINGCYWRSFLTKKDQVRITNYTTIFPKCTEINTNIKNQIKYLLRSKEIKNILK